MRRRSGRSWSAVRYAQHHANRPGEWRVSSNRDVFERARAGAHCKQCATMVAEGRPRARLSGHF